MTYELAKQLKDAGHPFVFEQGDGIHLPTLSELIEACGTPIDLHISSTSTCSAHRLDSDAKTVLASAYAKTPEEAVAKLWLSLYGRN